MATKENLRLAAQDSPENLSERFEFSLDGHEPIDPDQKRGTVTDVREVPPYSLQGNHLPEKVRVYEMSVDDPYLAADPTGYDLVTDYVNGLETSLRESGFDVRTGRSEARRAKEYNDFTRAWFAHPSMETGRLWRDLVPTAEALDYLLEPDVGKEITNRDGESTRITKEAALQLRFVHDAIGIRDRSSALQEIAARHLGSLAASHKHVRWLSLASGTAKPALAAAHAVEAKTGTTMDLVLADYDSNALDHVAENAQQMGFRGRFIPVKANIVRDGLRDELVAATGEQNQQYDVVENMGFKEYLPQEGDEMSARRGRRLPQASEFTRQAYSYVKPGGILISGNMVLPRPQTDFVFGVIDWPLINARSEESILRVYEQAGILAEPGVQLELFRVKNQQTGIHIYDIVVVRKPALQAVA